MLSSIPIEMETLTELQQRLHDFLRCDDLILLMHFTVKITCFYYSFSPYNLMHVVFDSVSPLFRFIDSLIL